MLTQNESRAFQAFEDRREREASGDVTRTKHKRSCLCAQCLSGEEPERCAYCDCVEVAEPGDYCSDACEAAAEEDAAADRSLNAEREMEDAR